MRTGGLAEGGHVGRVATECRDVVLYPAQGQDLIAQPQVIRTDPRWRQVTEDAEPVAHVDHHHIAGAGQGRGIVFGRLPAAGDVRAAVKPHHDR